MKKNLKNIAIIVSLFFGISSSVFAADINSRTVLATDSKLEFVNYLQINAKGLIDNNDSDIKAFNSVVSVYNASTTDFLNYNEMEKSRFVVASAKIIADLRALDTMESRLWAEKIETTAKLVNFIWSFEAGTDANLNTIELPLEM